MGSKFGALRVLVLSRIRLLGDANLVSIAECFPALEELDISYPLQSDSARVTDDGISDLSRKLQRLSRMNLSGNRSLSDQSLVVLSVNCPSLKEIKLGGCGSIIGRGIAPLIVNRPHLVSLALNYTTLEAIFREELVDSFGHSRGFISLDFSGSFIWDGLLMAVAEANIPLKRLILSRALGFSFDEIQMIMLCHQDIEVLDLEAVRFLTDDDMSVICEDLRSLTHINICRCSNLTMATLYSLMTQCPFLKAIKMGKTNLREDDANETDIVVNSQVRYLHIPYNGKLTDECLKKIRRMCPNLQYLDVSNCSKITGDGISGVLKSCAEICYLKICGLKNIRNLCIDFESHA
ncbi:F-box/LRR-repeat protein 2-like [Eucalyptus grandis]|uniref:F-box/LRR-repeat protein 2-like n=1 Tax=Eucalyptus grandis TaxID=71139 RepID=UPI0005264A47|nr:F-box/LRR-repeat protein 2-like [Eucalyptus grandis]XP_039168334.1 F-box/LRR-repeat protein 2-like [Eucalyptus grandis]